MGRVRLSVEVYYSEEDPRSQEYNPDSRHELIPPWLEPCSSDLTLERLIPKINESFKKIYPNRGDLNVKCLKDAWWRVVQLHYTVGEIFDDTTSGNADILTSTVRVIRESAPPTLGQISQRHASVAPNSSARPQKRRPEVSPHPINSDVNWQPLRPVQDTERAVKRQRLNEITSRDFQDRDHPLISCEATRSVPYNAISQTSRYYSPALLVEDSQRSPLSKHSNAYATPTSLSVLSPNMPPDSSQPEEIPDSPCGPLAAHVDLDANDTKSECSIVRNIHDAPVAERRGSPELAAIARAEHTEPNQTGSRQPPVNAHPDDIASEKFGSGRQIYHKSTRPPHISAHNAEPDLAPEVTESRFPSGNGSVLSDTVQQMQPAYAREVPKVANPFSKSDGKLTRPTVRTPTQPKRPTLIDSEQQNKLSSIWNPIDSDTEKSLKSQARRRTNGRPTSSQLHHLTSSNLNSSQRMDGLLQGSETGSSMTNESSTSSHGRRRQLVGLGTSAATPQRGIPGSSLTAWSYQADVPLSSEDGRFVVGGEPQSAASISSSVHQRLYTSSRFQALTMSQASDPPKAIQSDGRVDLTNAEGNESRVAHREQEFFDVEKAEEDALLNESLRTESLSLPRISKGRGELSEKSLLFKDVAITSNDTNRSDQAQEDQHPLLEERVSVERTSREGDHPREAARNHTDAALIASDAEDGARLLQREIKTREQKAEEDRAKQTVAKEQQKLKATKSQSDRKAEEEEEARKAAVAKEQAKVKEAKAKETRAKETKAKEAKAKEAKAKEAKLQEERKAKAEEKSTAEKAKQQKKAKEEEKARIAEIARQEAKVKAQKAIDERKKAKAQEHAERQAQILAASIATPQPRETTASEPTKKRKSTAIQGGSVKAKKPNPRTPQVSSDPVEEQERKHKSLTPAFPDSSGSKPPSSARIDAISSDHSQSLGLQSNGQLNLQSALRQSPSTLRRSVSFANDPIDTPEALAPSRSISRASISGMPSRALGSSPIGSISVGDKGSLRKPSLMANGKSSKTVKTYSTKKPSANDKVQTKITETVTRDVKLKGKMPEPAVIASDEIVISSDSEKSISSYYSEPEEKPNGRNAKAGPSSRMKRPKQDTHSGEENGFSDDGIPILQTQTKRSPRAATQPIVSIPSKLASHADSKAETGATSSSRSSRSPARYDIDKSATPEWITSESGSQTDQDSEDGLEIVGHPSRNLPKPEFSKTKVVHSSKPVKIDKTKTKPQESTLKLDSADRATPSEVSKSSSLQAKRPFPSAQTNGKNVKDEVDQQLQREIHQSGECDEHRKPSPKAIINGGLSKAMNKPSSNVKPNPIQKADPRAGGIQHFPSLTDIRSQPEIYKGWEPPPDDRRPDFMKTKRSGVPEAAKAVVVSEDNSSESEDESSSDDDSEESEATDAGKKKPGAKSLGRLLKLSKLLPSNT